MRRDRLAARPASGSSSSGEAVLSSCLRSGAPTAILIQEAGFGLAIASAVQWEQESYWKGWMGFPSRIDVVRLTKTSEAGNFGVLFL